MAHQLTILIHCPTATPRWLLCHHSSVPFLALPVPTPPLHPTKLPQRVQPGISLPPLLPQVVGIFLLLIHASVTSHFFFSADAGCAHPGERLKPQAAALGTGPLPATCCQLSQKPASVLSKPKPLPLLGSSKGNFRGSFSPYLPNPNPGLPAESSCWVQHTSSFKKPFFLV